MPQADKNVRAPIAIDEMARAKEELPSVHAALNSPKMKIPEFKPSREYFGDIGLPCLVAKVKNSALPKVATRHIAEYKSDPLCKIYLRCAKGREISEWQKEMLERLFEKEELPAILEEGMKEYETGKEWPGYDQHEEDNYRDIKRYGILPHLILSAIVIDDVTREVIIGADTDWDGHLNEHGITIYLSEGRWRFDLGDRQYDYSSTLQSEIMEKRMATVFPDAERGTKTDTDATFLYGTWKFDKKAALLFYKRLKWTRSQVSGTLDIFDKMFVTISPTKFRKVFVLEDIGEDVNEEEFVGSERRGDMVAINVKASCYINGSSQMRPGQYRFYYKDNLLMNIDGMVLRRQSGKK